MLTRLFQWVFTPDFSATTFIIGMLKIRQSTFVAVSLIDGVGAVWAYVSSLSVDPSAIGILNDDFTELRIPELNNHKDTHIWVLLT